MAELRMEEQGPRSEGDLLADRRRPGRREDLSPALIALVRRPSATQAAEIACWVRAYDAWQVLDAPSEARADPVRVVGVLGAVAFCAASWLCILRLLLAI